MAISMSVRCPFPGLSITCKCLSAPTARIQQNRNHMILEEAFNCIESGRDDPINDALDSFKYENLFLNTSIYRVSRYCMLH